MTPQRRGSWKGRTQWRSSQGQDTREGQQSTASDEASDAMKITLVKFWPNFWTNLHILQPNAHLNVPKYALSPWNSICVRSPTLNANKLFQQNQKRYFIRTFTIGDFYVHIFVSFLPTICSTCHLPTQIGDNNVRPRLESISIHVICTNKYKSNKYTIPWFKQIYCTNSLHAGASDGLIVHNALKLDLSKASATYFVHP